MTIDPEREIAELKEYLGNGYDHARLQRYEEAVDQELAEVGDEQALTAFAMSRTKEPYLANLTDLVPRGEDPFASFANLERLATLAVVNFLEPLPDEVDVHNELPIPQLLEGVAARRLRRYRIYHGRAHLVLYEGRPGSKLIGRARIAAGRIRGQREER
jgi:hypothetical protein